MWLKPASAPSALPTQEKSAISEPEASVAPVKKAQDLNTYDIPPGQVRRQVGDVFLWSKSEYVVESVGQCSARAICLTRGSKTVTNKLTGESATFSETPRAISISTCADRDSIIRRIENFQPSKSDSGAKVKSSDTNNQPKEQMKKEKKASTGTILTLIVGLAKSGKSEKEITTAVKGNYGPPSAHITYIIGREWRRVNKKVAKVAAKVPAPKKSAKPAAAPKKAKAAKVAALPPPPPKPVAAQTEEPAAGE